MRRVGFAWWELLAAIGCLGIVAGFFIPASRPIGCPRPPLCSTNLKQISTALMQYNHDYNSRLPPVGRVTNRSLNQGYGWADSLWPYIKNMNVYKCPQGYAEAHDHTDYYFNPNLSGFQLKKLPQVSLTPQNIIVFGDGNDTETVTTSAYNLNALPLNWISNPKSPAYRHNGMANYAFLDGHVKALPPDQITNEALVSGKPTFAVR